jgi:hypothetical protein
VLEGVAGLWGGALRVVRAMAMGRWDASCRTGLERSARGDGDGGSWANRTGAVEQRRTPKWGTSPFLAGFFSRSAGFPGWVEAARGMGARFLKTELRGLQQIGSTCPH